MSKLTHKPITLQEFRLKFGTEGSCLKYLADQKWSSSYHCRKCNHSHFCKGKQLYSRRCSSCGFDESPTSHTVFHKLKFSIVKAFEMIYRVAINKKGMSSAALSRELGVSQHSCWYFRRKIQQTISNQVFYGKLKGRVQVDEFVVGGAEEEAPGRAFGKKRKVLIITEIIEKEKNGEIKEVVGNQMMYQVETYRKAELLPLIEKTIDKDKAILQTDEFKTYISIRDINGWDVDAQKSNKGNWQPQIHCQIMNFKGWLRGIHHKCHPKYLQDYINEFCYRFNRRNWLDTIAFSVLKRFAFANPILHKQLVRKNTIAI